VSSPVGLTENGNRLNPQLAAGTNHPQRDFATVSNQDALKHFSQFFEYCSERN
jgi:hypothetical protein